MECQNSMSAWKELENRFNSSSVIELISHFKSLCEFSYSSNKKTDYFKTLMELSRNLFSANNNEDKIKIKDLISIIAIASLSEEYSNVRAIIQNNEKIPDIKDIEKLINLEEKCKDTIQHNVFKIIKKDYKCFGEKCWKCHPDLKPKCEKCKSKWVQLFSFL